MGEPPHRAWGITRSGKVRHMVKMGRFIPSRTALCGVNITSILPHGDEKIPACTKCLKKR